MSTSLFSLELSRTKVLALFALAIAINSMGLPQFLSPVNNAASIQTIQETSYYFHHLGTPVSVDGSTSNYVANTTAQFDYNTQQQAIANSFYKPTGQPTILLGFYSYPNFASPTSYNGTWQVFVYANASAYKTVGFTLEFKEYALGSGTAAWDSGQINPTVTSTVGSYVDVPVNSYNLTTPGPIGHVFAKDSSLNVLVTVNTGASSDVRVWYDSSSYPSKMLLPLVTGTTTPGSGTPTITTSLLLLLIGVVLVAGTAVFFAVTGKKKHSTSTSN